MPSKTKSINLPSAARFAALPLSDRTKLFARWLKAQPRRKRYDWCDTTDCPLGRFAQALSRDKRKRASGGATNVTLLPDFVAVDTMPDKRKCINALSDNTTFGAASDAFQAALAKPNAVS